LSFVGLQSTRLDGQQWLSTDCPPYFTKRQDGCYLDIPYLESGLSGLQTPITVSKDRLDPKLISLGKLLFFDPLLSKDKDISCAQCHQPAKGLADGLPRSLGTQGAKTQRAAPSLWNTGFKEAWFWDGRAQSLEEQALGPLFSPKEMGNQPQALINSIAKNRIYRRLFKSVFGEDSQVTVKEIALALSEFERTLVSMGSRFDAYVFGDRQALNQNEMKGLNLFRSFVTRCSECHTPPLFTNHQLVRIGVRDQSDDRLELAVVPTLRNIVLSAPYMHNGAFKSLANLVLFYDLGGGRGPLGKPHSKIHWHIRKMGLNDAERRNLVSFLGTLTDIKAMPSIPKSLPSGLSAYPVEVSREAH
jgi:cytochrome c peroxidase